MKLRPIKTEKFYIGKTPCVLYGTKRDKLFICVHGLCGNKEEAERFAKVALYGGYQVLAVDLPEHGERKDDVKLVPWEAIDELKAVMDYAVKKWRVSVRAVSIGAYYALMSFCGYDIEKCLFVSPLVDMCDMIEGMLKAAGADIKQLERDKNILFNGQNISWRYYCFAQDNPPKKISADTSILCSDTDYVVNIETVKKFAEENDIDITFMAGGEHFFHTEKQIDFLERWECERLFDKDNLDELKGRFNNETAEKQKILDEFMCNINRLHTTALSEERIKSNLKLNCDPLEYCKKLISGEIDAEFNGKNINFISGDVCITVNRSAYSVITAKNKRRYIK